MNQWQYLEDFDLTPSQLDELGREGWELVAVNSINDPFMGFRLFYTFKKLRQDDDISDAASLASEEIHS